MFQQAPCEKTHIPQYNQSGPIVMYRGLVVSGAILAIFGGFLVFTDLYVPLGASIFGLPISVTGGIMFVVGLLRPEPKPVEPESGKKFCWYCMEQIPRDAEHCPNCSLPQHEASD
jgi:hypothetical protein